MHCSSSEINPFSVHQHPIFSCFLCIYRVYFWWDDGKKNWKNAKGFSHQLPSRQPKLNGCGGTFLQEWASDLLFYPFVLCLIKEHDDSPWQNCLLFTRFRDNRLVVICLTRVAFSFTKPSAPILSQCTMWEQKTERLHWSFVAQCGLL